jgi:hypothetical protein
MSSYLQSAIPLVRLPTLPFGNAIKPGTALTTPTSGIQRVVNGALSITKGVDIVGYATRDSELMWRDVAVNWALEKICRKASTAFAAKYGFPLTPISNKSQTAYDSTVLIVKTASAAIVAHSGVATTAVSLATPVVPASVQVTIYQSDLAISNSVDDGNRNIVATGLATDPDTLTPQGSITGGTVNYELGTLNVQTKKFVSGSTTCDVTYSIGAIVNPRLEIAAGATAYSSSLTFVPVDKGTIQVFVGEDSSVDDGFGRIASSGKIIGGEIDYESGRLELVVSPTTEDRSVSVKYNQVKYLDASTADLDPAQAGVTLGGLTDVLYVTNSSVPRDALVSDKHLFRRDLILYEVLSLADRIFARLPTAWKIEPDLTIPDGSGISRATIDDSWSHAEAISTRSLPQYSNRWSPETFANPDRYLAWRDNVLAPYVAKISASLVSMLDATAELQAIATETDVDILVEDETI